MPPSSRPHAPSRLAPLVTLSLVALLSALPAACGDDALTSADDGTAGASITGAARPDTVRVGGTARDTTRRDSTRRDTTGTPAGEVVTAFDLAAVVFAPGTPPAGSRDTARSVNYPGARVTVYRVERAAGAAGAGADTAGTRVPVGTGTTDALGVAWFRNLPSGSYTVIAAPAAGAALLEGRADLAPPRQASVRVAIFLPAKR